MTNVSIEELEALHQEPNELAFLAATTKVELAVRDRFARRLHRRARSGLVVAREWERVDSAMLVAGEPVLLLESKAWYDVDCLTPGKLSEYVGRVQADLTKMRSLAPGAGAFALALITHVGGPVAVDQAGAVKYGSGVNAAQVAHGDQLKAVATAKALGALTTLGQCPPVDIPGGQTTAHHGPYTLA